MPGRKNKLRTNTPDTTSQRRKPMDELTIYPEIKLKSTWKNSECSLSFKYG